QDLCRIAASEHEATEVVPERREAVVQPPAAGGPQRTPTVLVKHEERHHRPAFCRCGERRIVADAQILPKPDDRGHDSILRFAWFSGSPGRRHGTIWCLRRSPVAKRV